METRDKRFVENAKKGNVVYLALGILSIITTLITLAVYYISWVKTGIIPTFRTDPVYTQALIGILVLFLFYTNKRFVDIIKKK